MPVLRWKRSLPSPSSTLPVIVEPDCRVTVSSASAASESAPKVTLPEIAAALLSVSVSAPLPVLTSPVMLDALSVRVSVLPLAISPAMPIDTSPSTEESALRLMLSEPEPVVIEPVKVVLEAVRVSPPSLLLLSLPSVRVLPVPPIVASVNVS